MIRLSIKFNKILPDLSIPIKVMKANTLNASRHFHLKIPINRQAGKSLGKLQRAFPIDCSRRVSILPAPEGVDRYPEFIESILRHY